MVRRGFPFNHMHLSFAQWLAARTTLINPDPVPVVLTARDGRFDQPSGIGAFKPKILSTIQPTLILQGHRLENYRVLGPSEEEILNSASQQQQNQRPGDETEHSSSGSLSIEDMQMFVGRSSQLEANVESETSTSSTNTLSSLSSLLSEEGFDVSDFINSEFVLRNPAGGQDRYFGRMNTPRVLLPVRPPPYPYPEEPPPTYEEAMLSLNPDIDALAAEEVAITLAELDSVLSEYPPAETHNDAYNSADWVNDLPTLSTGYTSQLLSNYDAENWDQTVCLPARPTGNVQTTHSEAWSSRGAQNDELVHSTMSQGVQTDGSLLADVRVSNHHDIASQSAQNSNQSAQTCNSAQSFGNSDPSTGRFTPDLWTEIPSDMVSGDHRSGSALHAYIIDGSYSFPEQFPASYINERDLLY